VNAVEAWDRLEEPWRVAFELAWEAFAAGTIPVGAVVVDKDGAIISRGRNRIFDGVPPPRQLAGTRLAHAEMNALAQLTPDRRWTGCTLYTTLEPCVLCVGAASISTIGRILFAGADVYSGSSSLAQADLATPRPLNVTIEGPLDGPLESVGAALHLAYFAQHDGTSALVETYTSRRPTLGNVAARLLGLRNGTLEAALAELG